MKTVFLFVFVFFAVPAFGQNADSLAVAREVDSLIQVSRTLAGQQAFDKALEVNVAAENMALARFGRESAAYGNCCHTRGFVMYYKTDYPEAEKWYLEAKAIREKVLGKEHPAYEKSLANLASLYWKMGNYEKAEPLYLETKAIREKVLGKEHPDYAGALINLGLVYGYMGNYEKSESVFLEAKEIFEIRLKNLAHPFYIYCLNNLGSLYLDMGNYEKAEPFCLEAKALCENMLGKEHPDYALILNTLATLYLYIGNYEKAETLWLETKTIREKVLGKEHPDYAVSLHNLATLYLEIGNYEKAETLYLETKALYEKMLGKEHPDYAATLNNLANLYLYIGNYEKAETLHLDAKVIHEKVFGNEHPTFARSLHNLAILYKEMGNHEKAEPLYLEAKALREKAFGKEHPDYIESLTDLTNFYETQNRLAESEPLLKSYFEITQSRLLQSRTFLSERELANYRATFQANGNNLSSYLIARRTKNEQTGILPALCYDHSLFHKGFLITAVSRLDALAGSSPETKELNSQLKSYRRRLAAEYAKPIAERKGLDELEAKANTTEKELARTVAGYADAMRQAKWQEVQSALKQNEAAIEFVHFRATFPKSTNSTMYAALVLSSGMVQPAFIPLFEEKQLDSLLHTTSERKADYVNALYTIAERSTKPLGKPKKSLYELLWKPLEKHLAGVNTVYYSPSGLLHRLNLAAIPIGLDSALADRHHFVELGSTRQLVIPNEYKPAANDAVLFGGIQYDADSTAIAQANAALDSISIASRGELSFTYADSSLRVGTWSDLPFTDREITGIERIMQTAGIETETRRGYSATEETFKSIGAGKKPSPRILHIATHGFFFPDPKSERERSERVSRESEPVFKLSDHPMIRSGLILAGGNHAWATGKSAAGGLEDGILTAYEISQMNLSNTELVVLSACETGLGDIQGNEGVYGLQRAFKIAGAKYLIMSLWQVPDKQTSLLMTTFYKKWLEDKMAIPEAFRAAQRELREAGLDPYYWAGFVLVE